MGMSPYSWNVPPAQNYYDENASRWYDQPERNSEQSDDSIPYGEWRVNWMSQADLVSSMNKALDDPLFQAYQMVNPWMDAISVYEKYLKHKELNSSKIKSQEDFDKAQDQSETDYSKTHKIIPPHSVNLNLWRKNPEPSRRLSDYSQYDLGWKIWTIYVPKTWNSDFFLKKWEDWKMKLYRQRDIEEMTADKNSDTQYQQNQYVRDFYVHDIGNDWSITLPTMKINKWGKKAQLTKHTRTVPKTPFYGSEEPVPSSVSNSWSYGTYEPEPIPNSRSYDTDEPMPPSASRSKSGSWADVEPMPPMPSN